MSYSPTVYCASILTPSAAAVAPARRSASPATAPAPASPGRTCGAAGVGSKYSTRRGARVGVEVVEERPLADVDLLALEERRHRDDDGELLGIALEVVRHREDGAVAVAHQDHLRGLVEELGVGLGDVEAAEGLGRLGGHRRWRREEGDGQPRPALVAHRCLHQLSTGRDHSKRTSGWSRE